jgi:hypothetical protein
VEIGRSTARALGRVLRSKQRRLIPLLAAGSGAGGSLSNLHRMKSIREDDSHRIASQEDPSPFCV